MILIVCIDDSNGILFNKRRVSRDKAVCDDIISFCKDRKLYMKKYSYELFEAYDGTAEIHIAGEGDYDISASQDVYFFCEEDADELAEKADEVIVYRWNRHYPSDIKFTKYDIIKTWTLMEQTDFPGKSHINITKEVYHK